MITMVINRHPKNTANMKIGVRYILATVLLLAAFGTCSAQTATIPIGGTLKLSGVAPGADNVYLFLTGANLPANGVKLDDISVPVVTGNPNTFVVVPVSSGTWEYAWDTSTAGGILDAGTYEIYAVTSPTGRKDLSSSDSYAIIAVSLTRPTITATTGSLSIQSQPPGASVLFDGTPAGTTPLDLVNLTPGNHTVNVSKAGFKPVSGNAGVVSGKDTNLSWTLEPEISPPSPSSSPSPMPTRAAGYSAVILALAFLIVAGHVRKN